MEFCVTLWFSCEINEWVETRNSTVIAVSCKWVPRNKGTKCFICQGLESRVVFANNKVFWIIISHSVCWPYNIRKRYLPPPNHTVMIIFSQDDEGKSVPKLNYYLDSYHLLIIPKVYWQSWNARQWTERITTTDWLWHWQCMSLFIQCIIKYIANINNKLNLSITNLKIKNNKEQNLNGITEDNRQHYFV